MLWLTSAVDGSTGAAGCDAHRLFIHMQRSTTSGARHSSHEMSESQTMQASLSMAYASHEEVAAAVLERQPPSHHTQAELAVQD
jgi:hypothetical protein